MLNLEYQSFMNLKKTLILTKLLIFSSLLIAQSVTLRGIVIDNVTQEEVPFATVAIFANDDKALVSGTTTGLDGRFTIQNVKPGDYNISVSFIGYTTSRFPFSVTAGKKEVSLEPVLINRETLELEELEVSAMARAAVNRLDRISYRAEDFETARGGTAAELLSKLPSLSVSPDGEISVRGTTDFIVYLNGRPTQLEPSVLLAQIPAGSIVGVDIITVPTAGFDAQGKGGVININTKSQALDGLSVSANAMLGGSPWGNRSDDISGDRLSDDRYGSAFNLVYAAKGWVLTGGINYNKRNVNSDRSGVARIRVPGSNNYKHMIASGLKPELHENIAANAGFEKSFSEKSKLIGSYFLGIRTEIRTANYLYNNYFGDITQNPVPSVPTEEEYTFNPNKGIRKGMFNTVSLDYSLIPDKESKFALGMVYEYSELEQDVDNPNIRYDKSTNKLQGKLLHYRQNDETPLHGLRFSADYSRNFSSNHTFSTGFQPQFVKISGSFDYDTLNLINNLWGAYSSLENSIELTRNVYAGYADLAGQWSKLTYKAGLRLEYTDQTLEFANPDYFSLLERPGQKRFDENHLDLFPGLYAAYQLSKNDKLNFAAGRRISRAPVKNMAPFLYRRHLEVYVVGDPELKPEYINTAEFTYSKTIDNQQVSLTGFYRKVSNAVFRVNTVYAEELILIRTFTNAGKTEALGCEINTNFEFGKKAKFYLGASMYNFHVEADIFGYREDHRSTNWNLKGNMNILLSRQLRFVADFNVRSAEVTAQGKDKMRYMANAALTYNPSRLTSWAFNLRALNVLDSNTNGISTRAYNSEKVQIFYQDTDFYWYGPVAELTVSYQFNWKNQSRTRTESSFGKDEF